MTRNILKYLTALAVALGPQLAHSAPVTYNYDYTGTVVELYDIDPFGSLAGGPFPTETPDTTPFFGFEIGDEISASLNVTINEMSGFPELVSSSCDVGGYGCTFDDFASATILDPALGTISYSSTNYSEGTEILLGDPAGFVELDLEWGDMDFYIFRHLRLEDIDLSPAVAIAPMPLPGSLPLLAGLVVFGGIVARKRSTRQ